MTCSSSSNIKSSQTFVSITQGGSRLMTTIPNGSYSLGITAGDVIFYNGLSGEFQKSIATSSNTAEVFGIVETKTAGTLNVVIYGSIVLPSSSIHPIAGATGGAGGADVYFLSGITSGKVQVEAPSEIGNIIKPIYQVAPHGSYTGTVMNYIGYRLGGEVEAFGEEPIGQVIYILRSTNETPGNATDIPNNYVDARISHELRIGLYDEFYKKYGKQFGFVEELTVKNGYFADSRNINKTIYRSDDPNTTGIVVATASDTKYYVKWSSVAATTTTSQKLVVQGGTIEIDSSSVYSIYTPIITVPSPFSILDVNRNSVSVSVVPAIQLTSNKLSVNVPQTVSIKEVIAETVKLGTSITFDNVNTILDDLETRLTAVETRLLM